VSGEWGVGEWGSGEEETLLDESTTTQVTVAYRK
jgi:hypothetical protein